MDKPQIFQALASEQRLAIAKLLMANPAGLHAGEIAERTNMPKNLFSFHAQILEKCDLLHSKRTGRMVKYFINSRIIEDLITYFMKEFFMADGVKWRLTKKAVMG